MLIKFKKQPEAKAPTRGYTGDAGWDLYALEETSVPPMGYMDIPTGIYAALPEGFWARITARSSTFRKFGLLVGDAVIDNGYRGELFIQVVNPFDRHVVVSKHARVAQVILHRIHELAWVEAETLPSSDRGNRGFGSTGI